VIVEEHIDAELDARSVLCECQQVTNASNTPVAKRRGELEAGL